MGDFKRLLPYIKPYRSYVFSSIVCHVLMAVFTVVSIPLIIPFFQVLFSRTPIERIKPDAAFDIIGWLEYYFVGILDTYGTEKSIIFICAAIVITFLLKNIFRYLAMYFMVPVRSNIVKDLRSNLYSHYLDYNPQNQDHQRGDLIARITSDVQEVEWSILRFIETIFKSPVIIVGSILLMLNISPYLTLFVFVLMLFTGLVIGTLSKTLKKQSSALQSRLASMTSIVDESLDGKLHIDIFGVRKFWNNRFNTNNYEYSKMLNKVSWRQDLSSPLSEFLGVTVVVVLLWYGSNLVLKSELMPETFFAFIFAFYNVIEPSKSFSSAFYNVKKGAAALERIDQVMESQNLIGEEGSMELAGSFEQISFKDIAFSYDKDVVLSDVNFDIKKGEKLAIVGPSGAGKSTIIMLLLKKLFPNRGHIYIDQNNLQDIKNSQWYQQIGLVTQRPFLYHDTLRNNVTLGRTGITDEKIWAALNEAHCDTFVRNLPQQLDTIVGDRGDQLSGGEQQRITIARALLSDPSLIIFDEPTSALDPISERKVSQAIIDALKERTAIIIAHRLSTIKYADRILVLKDGKIVEQGKHKELLNQNGVYAEYVEMQSIS